MAQLEDFDALVNELVAKDGLAETGGDKKDEGFQLHLAGKDYKFETREAAERALETHMARLEQAAKDADNRATAATRVETPPPAPALKEGEVDPRTKEFVQALEKADFKTMANIMLKHGVFDGKVDDGAAVLTDSLLRTAQLDRGNAVQTFLKDHPELATNNAAASAVEQARVFLNLPATPDGFEAAHAYAERRGFIQRPDTNHQNGYQTGGTRSGPPAPPNRSSSATGSGQPQSDAEWEAFYNSRSDDELNKLMNAAYGRR